MNPIYSIQESPYRWLLWSGIAFLAGTFGAMFMLAYHWPHFIALVWLVVLLTTTVICLALAVRQWKREFDAALDENERAPATAVDQTAPRS